MRSLGHFLVAGALLAASASLSRAEAQLPATGCHRADYFTDSLVNRGRFTLSLPAMSYLFEGSGLSNDDQRRIYALQTDSLCRIASRTISRELQAPDTTTRAIYLLSVGKLYWAVDRSVKGGEFYLVYILDGTLTKILFRTMG